MPKHRAASEEDVDRLHRATDRCTRLSERLAGLVDEDSGAYDQVVAAYRLPRGSEAEKAERSARIQEALKAAVEVPLEVMRRSAEAIEAASVVAAFGNSNAASDVGVALELLGAGARGARLNVEINLPDLKNAELADRARVEASTLAAECETGVAAARARLA
jgi:glutamate formiminotransferase/formiminotetrahydrofolate cyclodeaminase